MTNGAAAGAAAAAAHAVANATKASGLIVRVRPEEFMTLLGRATGSMVVQATAGFFSTKYRYVLHYKGFGFYTQSPTPIDLPANVETVQAEKIWIPD